MDKLTINYKNTAGGEGTMELNCEAFFPCKKKAAKIVFPLAVQNCTSETIHELKTHLVDKKEMCEQALEFYSKEYDKSAQNAAVILQLIATGKHPSGVKATPEELAIARDELNAAKAQSRSNLAEFKKNRRHCSMYAENIELLEQYSAKEGVQSCFSKDM